MLQLYFSLHALTVIFSFLKWNLDVLFNLLNSKSLTSKLLSGEN